MLTSVLRSDRAAHVNVEIMRAFVRLRQLVAGNASVDTVAPSPSSVPEHDPDSHRSSISTPNVSGKELHFTSSRGPMRDERP